jgi:hypothetical protein
VKSSGSGERPDVIWLLPCAEGRRLPRGSWRCPADPGAVPPKRQSRERVAGKLCAAARSEHAPRAAGRAWGPEAPATRSAGGFGVPRPQRAMGPSGARGGVPRVLAGGVLAAALALGAGGWLPAGPGHPIGAPQPPELPTAPGAGPGLETPARHSGTGPERSAQVSRARAGSGLHPGATRLHRRWRGPLVRGTGAGREGRV